MSEKRLLASIHDVGPRFADAVDHLVDRLSRHLGGPRFAMLVVPDHWGQAPIAENKAFHRRMRDWHASGAEIFVHGWYHQDRSQHAGAIAAIKARHMTAGEGEFLGLDREEARRRMIAGRTLIEDIIGAPVAGFVAPAWLYGPGARTALADVGFALAEDHMRVWAPDSGVVLARGPVITWASRSRGRIASSLVFSALARHALAGLGVVRVAVHPGDVTVPSLLTSIDRTIGRLLQSHQAGRYADLLFDRDRKKYATHCG
jgi:predicted deacetylase